MGFLSNLFSSNSNTYRNVFLKAYPDEPWYCVSCGKALYKREGVRSADDKLTVDHIVPQKYGGSNAISNLQPMCQKCNTNKNR